MSDLLKNILN